MQPLLQIFQNQRDQADVGDFVFREGFANEFGAEGAEVDDRSSASERPEKADHEVNRVIRRKDAEVTDAGPEGIERSEGDALLEERIGERQFRHEILPSDALRRGRRWAGLR